MCSRENVDFFPKLCRESIGTQHESTKVNISKWVNVGNLVRYHVLTTHVPRCYFLHLFLWY